VYDKNFQEVDDIGIQKVEFNMETPKIDKIEEKKQVIPTSMRDQDFNEEEDEDEVELTKSASFQNSNTRFYAQDQPTTSVQAPQAAPSGQIPAQKPSFKELDWNAASSSNQLFATETSRESRESTDWIEKYEVDLLKKCTLTLPDGGQADLHRLAKNKPPDYKLFA